MNPSTWTPLAFVACTAACGASYPAPTQRMIDVKASEKSAAELGAQNNPQAQLHLKLAQEQSEHADALVADGQNRRAEYVLVRAKGDADLALALVKNAAARQEVEQVVKRANELQMQNQGGAPGTPMVAPSSSAETGGSK
jgi:hypothetical protein